jgi:GT2 family glycosyltransferase
LLPASVKRVALSAIAQLPEPAQRAVVAWYRRHAGPTYDAIRRMLRPDPYRRWVKLYDTLSATDCEAIAAAIAEFPYRPLISIVVPVFNTPERELRAALDSVFAQLYANWQLCIADDASTAPHVARVLQQYTARDQRVRVVMRPVNGGISAASNSAIELSSGDFIAFLDHDDALPAHALYMVAREIVLHPDVDLIYSDEDKLDRRGRRRDPYFKSDWNPDLFLSQNMISHLGVYRAALVRKVGGLRSEFDGSQDYDLALRILEQTGSERIRHIPHVLYHWRAAPRSTARSPEEKSYAVAAARRAVEDHLRRRGVRAEVTMAPSLLFQLVRYVLDREPMVSIIIPTRDRADLLSRCIAGILTGTDYRNLEILVVDNLSNEAATLAYLDHISREQRVRVLRYDAPFNFALINNWAAGQAEGEILLFLNNDIEVINPTWLQHMAANACRPEVGAVGARLLYPNGRVQHGGVILGIGGVAGHFHFGCRRDEPGYFSRAQLQQNLSAVTAACLAMRHQVFDEVAGFDGANLPIAYNDIDLCLRLRERGYLVVWTPLAELYHHESASRGSDLLPEQQPRFQRETNYMRAQWAEVLDQDPYFNPNLSLRDLAISLSFPPRVTYPWNSNGRHHPSLS